MTNRVNSREISIIIPAYKAESFIADNISGVVNALKSQSKFFEIIVVVDGNDDNTFEKAIAVSQKYNKTVKVLGYNKNRGKGYAVRFGMKRAIGEIIGFIDAGYEIEPGNLVTLIKIM